MRTLWAVIFITLFTSINFASTAKPVPVEHYSRLPGVYDAALSPNGNWLAVVSDNGGKYALKVFNLANATDRKTRAANYPDTVKVNWIKWANNEQLLMSTRQLRRQGGVNYNAGYLFVMGPDLKDARIVLDPEIDLKSTSSRIGRAGSIRQFNNRVIDFLSDDPDNILMAYGSENQFAAGVHKVNLKTRMKKTIERGTLDIQNWRTDLRGELRVGSGRKDRSGAWRMKIRDADGKTWREASNYPGLEPDTDVYGFMANPNEMIIGDTNGKDTEGLYIYDLKQKKRTRKLFHHDKYDVRGILISPDHKKVVGASYLADTIKREYFDSQYKARIARVEKKALGFQVRVIDQTPDGKKALFKAVSPSNAPMLYIFDFEKDKASFLAFDYPEIGKTQQGDVNKVSYTARDGYKIRGYITTPPKIADGAVAFKNQPFIIMPHGGPYSRDTASFDYLAQFMASRGYSVLQMNFRGSEGFGDAHEQAGRKNWEVMLNDVEDGTKWLIEKGYADPKRVCIVGWSYGGYAALMGTVKDPDLYTCAASIAGVTDLKDMVKDMEKYRFGNHAAKDFILKGFENKSAMAINSPVKNAKLITTPLFLAHGTRDVNVHYDQFKRMKSALKKSKAKTTFLSFKDEDHYFIDYDNRTKLLTGLDKFLAENLGDSAAAP